MTRRLWHLWSSSRSILIRQAGGTKTEVDPPDDSPKHQSAFKNSELGRLLTIADHWHVDILHINLSLMRLLEVWASQHSLAGARITPRQKNRLSERWLKAGGFMTGGCWTGGRSVSCQSSWILWAHKLGVCVCVRVCVCVCVCDWAEEREPLGED